MIGRARCGVGPRREARHRAADRLEHLLVPQVHQVRLVHGPHDEHREDAALVQEDDHLVAVEVGLPAQRAHHRSGFGAVVQLVLPVHVGDPDVAADGRRRPQRPGHPAGAAGGVDDQVRREILPVHAQAARPPTGGEHRVHMPAAQLQARLPVCGGPQRPLEGLPARAHADPRLHAVRPLHHDRLSPCGEPPLVRLGQLRLQRRDDLTTEGVRVVELHHPSAGPRAVGRGAGVAVDGGDPVTAAGERGAEEQAGRTGPDDRDVHPSTSIRRPASAPRSPP